MQTNVAGLLSCPPVEGKGVLLRHVAVTCDGAWSVSQDKSQPSFIKSEHDTTGGISSWKVSRLGGSFDAMSVSRKHRTTTCVAGGMAQKVKEAAQIAAQGIPVLLAQAGTKFSMQACKLGPAALKDPTWKGTSFELT